MNLVLITDGFPVNQLEPYLDTEIQYLSKVFDHVYIIHRSKETTPYLELPDNTSFDCYCQKERGYKVFRSYYLFHKDLISEILNLRNINCKLSFGLIKTMLDYYLKAKDFSVFLKDYPSDSIFYTYWTDFPTLACLLSGYKTISRFHGYDVYFERHPNNYLPFRKNIFKELSFASFISRSGRDYSENKLNTKIYNSAVRRLGLSSVNVFSPIDKEVSLRILSCSSIIELKRLDKIIDSLALIRDIDINWVHIGDGSLLDSLREYSANRLLSNVTWEFTGWMDNKDVIDFYTNNRIDLFINASTTEGIPYTFMEANSFSIPVIAPNVGGISEIVNDENGFLLARNPSPKAISGKIIEYHNSSAEERNKKREAAYNTWNEKYNAEKNYTQFVEDILAL